MLSRDRIRIVALTPAQMHDRLSDAMQVYIKAMNYSSGWEQRRRDSWKTAIYMPQWTCYAAFVELPHSTDTDTLVADAPLIGIVYGNRGDPASWWTRKVRAGMERSHFSPEEIDTTLTDYFELSELHVHPHFQGRGIGRELLTHVLNDHPNLHFLLSTPEVEGENNPAWTLYRSLGFQDLLRDFVFPGDYRHFGVLLRPAHTIASPTPEEQQPPALDYPH